VPEAGWNGSNRAIPAPSHSQRLAPLSRPACGTDHAFAHIKRHFVAMSKNRPQITAPTIDNKVYFVNEIVDTVCAVKLPPQPPFVPFALSVLFRLSLTPKTQPRSPRQKKSGKSFESGVDMSYCLRPETFRAGKLDGFCFMCCRRQKPFASKS
jgi:hypothetical protein